MLSVLKPGKNQDVPCFLQCDLEFLRGFERIREDRDDLLSRSYLHTSSGYELELVGG
jgi:hypothetical protein